MTGPCDPVESRRASVDSVDNACTMTYMTSTPTTSATDFLAARDEWVAAGRPADHPYAIAAAEVYASADGPAIGFHTGAGFVTVEL